MSDPRIRNATAADADAIASLLAAAFLEFQPFYTPEGFRATTPDAAGVLTRMNEGPAWIALDGTHVVGAAAAIDRGGEIYLRGMAVLPSARGGGVATRLLAVVTAFAVDRGAQLLTLSTTPFLGSAIRLYERHGFAATDDRLDLFGTPLIRMVKRLPRQS